MKLSLAHTLRHYDKKNIGKDILAGLIIMAVSIPISMGYALIAGLPAVYGLYGSVFPILVFALLSTSPQFIFGVDAAPAALIGSALLTLHVEAGSEEAMAVVPVLTFFVAMWLLAFSFMKAGKLVNYISAPVMGGFITGICSTIILMQVPKILGGTAGTGEFFELAKHIGQKACEYAIHPLRRGIACNPACGEKTGSEIPDGSCIDGGRCLLYAGWKCAGAWNPDTLEGGDGTSAVADTGFFSCLNPGGCDSQPVGGSCNYGGDVAGGE